MALKRRRSHPAAPLVGSSRPVLLWTANDATLGMDRYGSWAAGTAPVATSAPVGRALSFTGNTTNALTRAGVSTAAQTKFWFAALFRWRVSAMNGGNFPQLLGTSTGNNGWRVQTTWSSGVTSALQIVKGGVVALSSVTITDDVWYLAVGSNRQDTGEHYLILRPLDGGDLLRTATSSTATSSAGNGSAGIGISRTDYSGAWAGDIAFAAAGFEFLPEAFARQWLNAPRPTIGRRRIWASVAAGASWSSSLSESTTTTDAATAAYIATASVAESITAADSLAAATTWVRSLTEAATAAESVTTAAGTFAASITEPASVADALTSAVTWARTLTEAASASDLATAIVHAVAALTEAATASDSQATGSIYAGSVTESASVADALTAAATLGALLTEVATTSDAATSAATWVRLLTEPATAVDSVAGAQGATYTASVTEVLAAAELLVAVLGSTEALGRYTIAAKARRLTITAKPRRLEIRK